eukprot:CAMPEP_0179149466 /NCGR_PEP_ID=MMETSP0796-20121207/72410_1 /TAXON_ID=73915 /ORGANISM="Pyrodinium bahamense, Strain pbaha01" /LENGTH=118 /DNA_ID=CAMNT_0020850309 /DNA_START=39 /DNA_END=392 /DNA_ORIENTATION=+
MEFREVLQRRDPVGHPAHVQTTPREAVADGVREPFHPVASRCMSGQRSFELPPCLSQRLRESRHFCISSRGQTCRAHLRADRERVPLGMHSRACAPKLSVGPEVAPKREAQYLAVREV